MSDATLVTMELDCHFNPDGIKNLGIDMANAVLELEVLKSEKAAFLKDMAGRMKEVREKVKTLSTRISTGKERRTVDCTVTKDFVMKKVVTRRNDTNEIVDERPMTTEEQQQALFLDIDPTAKVIRKVDIS